MYSIYALCIFSLIQAGYSEMPSVPSRGTASYYANKGVLMLAVSLYLILIFIIADITHLSNHFIKLLNTNNVIWPENVLKNCSYKYGIPKNAAKHKVHMDLVNQFASDVNSIIYYPFFLLFLLILSRSHYFDNWHYTLLLFVIISFTAVIALGSAIRLRKGALDTRAHILEKLDEVNWHTLTNKYRNQDKQNSVRLGILINEIKNLQTGPFLPLLQQPIVRSVFLPFGGVGGLYLIEYLASI